MPEIMYRNMPTDLVRRMPDSVYQGNINLTNLPANERPQYTGLVNPALAASPLVASQPVEDQRSWSNLGSTYAGLAASALLGKAAGAALSPKLIGSLAASMGGGGGFAAKLAAMKAAKAAGTPVPKVANVGRPTAREKYNLEEAARRELDAKNQALQDLNAKLQNVVVPQDNSTAVPDVYDYSAKQQNEEVPGTGNPVYAIQNIKKYHEDVNIVGDEQPKSVPDIIKNPNFKNTGSTAKVDMSLQQIEDLAHRNSYYRDVSDEINAGSFGTPVKQKLFTDHVGRVIAHPRDAGGRFKFDVENKARNKALLSDINNIDLFRNYFKALSPEHPLFKDDVLLKTEANGKVFFELNPERKRKRLNPERDAQLSGNLIIRELKRNFPNAKTGYGGDLDSYNQGINAAKVDASRKAKEEIATTPVSRTIQLIQNNNPEGATIDRYPIPRNDMTQEEIATSINRQNFVRLNGDPTLYRVSPKKLITGANASKAVNHDTGTGDSLVHPPGKLNISGKRKSWELGKMMHDKSKAMDPNTPKDSVTWETMDGQTHTKHLEKMTRNDTNEFVEYYNSKNKPYTGSGEKIQGYTQIFGLGGAAAGAALMAPPDTRRAPERY